MPPPPRRTRKAEPEPPGSTPRRSGRDRRQEQQPAPVVSKGKGKTGAVAPQEQEAATKSRKQKATATNAPEEEVAASKTRKQKPAAQDSVTGKKRPPREPQQDSPGEAPSRARRKKGAEAPGKADAPTEDSAQPKRRGRKAEVNTTTEIPEASDPLASRGRRERPSKAKVAEEPAQEPGPAKTKRKALKPQRLEPEVEQEADPESSEDDEELPYRYIQETIRNISRSTITDKWTPLDPPAIHVISAFLADVQRSVLLRLQNTSQQRGHASAALGAMTRRLQARLGRGYPFPAPTSSAATRANAGSYEDDFDFERMVDAKQALEHTLNPLLHSVGLLEREIDKEETALARDYDQLHTLEANAKSVASEWRDKAKREHLLAPGIKKKGGREAVARNRLELVPAVGDGMSGGLFKVCRPLIIPDFRKHPHADDTVRPQDLEDEDLVALSQQIGSHMKSMKENLKQIEGVVPAIVQSKAALQHVLLQHLDDEQYDNVLLG